MGIDPDQLNQVLAQRLGAVVPDGFHIEAAEGMLRYSADTQVGAAGTYVRDNFAVHGETDEERAGGVTAQALDELQDYISEATHADSVHSPKRALRSAMGCSLPGTRALAPPVGPYSKSSRYR